MEYSRLETRLRNGNEKLAALPIAELELSTRAFRVVTRALDCTTIGEFLKLTRVQVLATENAGRKTWIEIHEMQEYLTEPSARELEATVQRFQNTLNVEVQLVLLYGATISRLTKMQDAYDTLEKARKICAAL